MKTLLKIEAVMKKLIVRMKAPRYQTRTDMKTSDRRCEFRWPVPVLWISRKLVHGATLQPAHSTSRLPLPRLSPWRQEKAPARVCKSGMLREGRPVSPVATAGATSYLTPPIARSWGTIESVHNSSPPLPLSSCMTDILARATFG